LGKKAPSEISVEYTIEPTTDGKTMVSASFRPLPETQETRHSGGLRIEGRPTGGRRDFSMGWQTASYIPPMHPLRAPYRRPRQCGVPASGPHQFFRDGGLRFDDKICHAAIATTDGAAYHRCWRPAY